MQKQDITIVWLKRDLRLQDNEAIFNAVSTGLKVLFLYVFEPSLLNDKHYSQRHWNFIKESIHDINSRLSQFNSKVLSVKGEVIPVFNMLLSKFNIKYVFSHQETGLKITFKRDKNFKRYCRNNLIVWKENVNNGVFRGRKNRKDWVEDWNVYMNSQQFTYKLNNRLIELDVIDDIETIIDVEKLLIKPIGVFQKGGTYTAKLYLKSFKENRYINYAKYISKPNEARISCSRLSPYFAWGNLSVRQVYQEFKEFRPISKNKRSIDCFLSRLRWQAHFIQKFEMECVMEEVSINRGFHKLKKDISEVYQLAWEAGKTGIPIIDACIRCLKTTGYLNFRMRAMVVSFFVHNLWQPWQAASAFLSRLFLDFEPGIHFPQLQMQSGEVGVNTIRIYNPIKNGLDHDPDGTFIDKWVPELKHLPKPFKHEPYKMTVLEQNFYDFKRGEDYPEPIIDVNTSRTKAVKIMWNMKKDDEVAKESSRILKKHVNR
ncbi:cryptochrome/deoxyribodipyrimidine photo-lyase family protein [Pseudofulvibacter geojedonensis]|uniref:Deoxyribodipyrimidine photo-lyase/cryptochrome family protein n=1 Tax=Pseudofulvibacter geojedonensis TaxID=1123758 RepID=A0ABW3I2F2_9FLAO